VEGAQHVEDAADSDHPDQQQGDGAPLVIKKPLAKPDHVSNKCTNTLAREVYIGKINWGSAYNSSCCRASKLYLAAGTNNVYIYSISSI
jgi:hypothetical protein